MDTSSSASMKMSSATNPHSRPINLATTSGVKGWLAGVDLPAHIPVDIHVGPEAKAQFRVLLEHLDVCGFGSLLKIPKSGTGVPGPSPIQHAAGFTTADHNLQDLTSITTQAVNLERKDVLKTSGWIHGAITDGLVIPSKLIQKELDFEATGNNGNDKLIAGLKQQRRIKSDQLMHILRQHINHTSLEALLAHKDIYVWERERDGTTFYCGLTVLWLILESIEPKTVVDAQEYETLIESLSLVEDCDGDVRQYLSKLKTARDELTIRHGKDRMTDNKFMKHLFGGLSVVTQPTFQALVSTHRSKYLMGDLDSKGLEEFLRKLDKLYTSLLTGKEWSVLAEPDPKMIALTTENKALQKKVSKLEQQASQQGGNTGSKGGSGKGNEGYTNDQGISVAGPPGTNAYQIELWRTVKKGPSITKQVGDKTVKYFWCNKHRHGKGLYMRQNKSDPDRHDHEEWKQGIRADKKKRRDKRSRKRGGDDSSVNSSASDQPRLVVKKLKNEKSVNVLVTKYGLTHEDALALALAHDPDVLGGGSDSDSSGN